MKTPPIQLWGVTTNFVHLDAYRELNLCGERCRLIGDVLAPYAGVHDTTYYHLLFMPVHQQIACVLDEERRRIGDMIDVGILTMRVARPVTVLDARRCIRGIYIALPPAGVSWDEAWAAGATMRALDAT